MDKTTNTTNMVTIILQNESLIRQVYSIELSQLRGETEASMTRKYQ